MGVQFLHPAQASCMSLGEAWDDDISMPHREAVASKMTSDCRVLGSDSSGGQYS